MNIEEWAGKNTHKKIVNIMKTKRRGKVLDIAAGPGNISFKLNNMGFDVIAADIDPSKFKPDEIPCVKVDANYKLPFNSESFDYVVSVETIEHLKNPWFFLDEIHRILKKDGTCILTSPNIETIQNRIFYLLKGRFNWFHTKEALDDHKTPIFSWIFKYMVKEKFLIINETFNAGETIGFLPRLGINARLPSIDNGLFGEIRIIEMVKK
ncbi:class I SAM-dependent methyltransferase [Methanothermobacter marburgensis]|uniref:class I SAM-dependent methyltransferase n=1 Tax=Methanothermobacter marburgensis TaxID=145263 RepID=UPI0035B82797